MTTAHLQLADLTPVASTIQTLQALEAELAGLLLERDETVRAALVAILARQHLVLLGAPGTAKSMLVSLLAERIAPQTGGGLKTFIWLLTRFTTPEELFGPISVAGLKRDEYRRLTVNKLPEAELAFLDEIFKANSAVLNALLTILNERAFDNGPQRVTVPLISLFGASNELPQGEDLAALWDRFALRQMVSYVSDTGFAKLMRLTAQALPPTLLSQADLLMLQQMAASLPIPDSVIDALVGLRKELAGKGISASDRRWRQTLDLLRAHALLEGRGLVEEDDLAILRDTLWTQPEQRQEIGRTVARLANPLNAKALELTDQAASVHQVTMEAQRNGADEAKMQAAVEGNTKLKSIAKQLKRLLEQAQSQGRGTTRIEKAIGQVKTMHQQVAELILEA
jgi:MoxR-like ATPase